MGKKREKEESGQVSTSQMCNDKSNMDENSYDYIKKILYTQEKMGKF